MQGADGLNNLKCDVIRTVKTFMGDILVLTPYTLVDESRGRSVSIMAAYGLDGQGSIPDRGRGFFL
jgi:hypothetical protein